MQTTTVSVSAGDIYRNGRDRDRNCGEDIVIILYSIMIGY